MACLTVNELAANGAANGVTANHGAIVPVPPRPIANFGEPDHKAPKPKALPSTRNDTNVD